MFPILTARVICELGAVVERIGNAFYLAKLVVGIGRCVAHRIGNGKRLIERVINSFADYVILGIGGLDHIAVAVVGSRKYVSASIGDGSSSAKRIVAIANDVIKSILYRYTLVQTVVGIGGDVTERSLTVSRLLFWS